MRKRKKKKNKNEEKPLICWLLWFHVVRGKDRYMVCMGKVTRYVKMGNKVVLWRRRRRRRQKRIRSEFVIRWNGRPEFMAINRPPYTIDRTTKCTYVWAASIGECFLGKLRMVCRFARKRGWAGPGRAHGEHKI